MKKKGLFFIICLLGIIGLLLPQGLIAKEKEIKLASWGPEKHYTAVARGKWVTAVNEQLAGKYKIIDYPGGQLYGPKQMHMAVAKGSIDIGVVLQPAMLGMVPMLQGVYLPFAFDNVDQAAKAYTGESLEIMEKAMEKKRIKLIYTTFLDGVQIFNNTKNIKTVEDLKGMRLLSVSPIVTQIFSRLGSAPDSSIPQNEQYMALKRGVSDAVANTTISGYFQRTFEVAPYVTKMNMSFPTILTCMNLKKWKKLPADARKIMLDEGAKAQAFTLASAKGWEAKFIGNMVNMGTLIKEIPVAERKKIQEISSVIWNEWAEKNGPEAKRLLKINLQ